MPVIPNKRPPAPPETCIYAPDVLLGPGEHPAHPATFMMDYNQGIPPDFDDLPPEEQERIMLEYRYGGIKLRGDITGETVPITRRTLDIP